MRVLCLLGLIVFICRPAEAQVDVTLPDVYGQPGDTVVFTVDVSDVTGEDVKGFTFKLLYNPNIIEVFEATLNGTVAHGSVMAENTATPGEYVVAAANARPLSGSGAITVMRGVLLSEGSDALQFEYFQFNDGEPEARTYGGVVRSGTSTALEPQKGLSRGLRLIGHYPEPVADKATLEADIPFSGMGRIILYDVAGREVDSRTIWIEEGRGQEIAIPIDHLPQGIYLYRLEVGDLSVGDVMTVVR